MSDESNVDTNVTTNEAPSFSPSPLSNKTDEEYKDEGISISSSPSSKEMNNYDGEVRNTQTIITDVHSSSSSSYANIYNN